MPILNITYHYFPDCLATQDTCHRFQRKLTKQQYKQCLAVADKNHKQVCSLTFTINFLFKISDSLIFSYFIHQDDPYEQFCFDYSLEYGGEGGGGEPLDF